MPAGIAGNTTFFGCLTGLLPTVWSVLNIIFLHQLTGIRSKPDRQHRIGRVWRAGHTDYHPGKSLQLRRDGVVTFGGSTITFFLANSAVLAYLDICGAQGARR